MDLGGSDWRRMVGRGLGVGGWERVWRGRTEGLGERTEGLGERTEGLGERREGFRCYFEGLDGWREASDWRALRD